MAKEKIILFLCNWGPHTAYQMLQEEGGQIPPEVRMVRIPCTGRITKALLFKAFEMGADGVALAGCHPGSCRYGSGTDNALVNTEDTREILHLLGLGRERMQLATFQPDDAEPLRAFLENFRDEVRAMGPSPIRAGKADAGEMPADTPEEPLADSLAEIVARHDANSCQDCGKCTSSCPLALAGKPFSPRALAAGVISGETDTEDVQNAIWSCLTCGLCYDRCPSGVNFPEFICDLRAALKPETGEKHLAHGGFFQSLMRSMTSPAVQTNRWEHLPDEIKLDRESKTLFFGGCAPYFDTFFKKHTGVHTEAVIEDSLRLLNFFDIHPAVLENERCCGHDLLWSGDRQAFLALARMNVEMIRDQGIEEVVTACPECYRTLAQDYPRFGVETGFTVTHIYEILEREIDKGAVTFNQLGHKITFQDSCRLNRFEHLRDLPRRLLSRLYPDAFKEMKDNQASAICCGNNAWTGCDAYSKALQVKRLGQARETGSDLLVTACPKCQIHLRCAMEDPIKADELKMEMMDLTGVIARTICWE